MFPLIPQDAGNVEEKILSYMSPWDLFKSKLVSKRWYLAVCRYMEFLKATNDLSIKYQLIQKKFEYQSSLILPAPNDTWVYNGSSWELILYNAKDGYKLCLHDRGCLCLIEIPTKKSPKRRA